MRRTGAEEGGGQRRTPTMAYCNCEVRPGAVLVSFDDTVWSDVLAAAGVRRGRLVFPLQANVEAFVAGGEDGGDSEGGLGEGPRKEIAAACVGVALVCQRPREALEASALATAPLHRAPGTQLRTRRLCPFPRYAAGSNPSPEARPSPAHAPAPRAARPRRSAPSPTSPPAMACSWPLAPTATGTPSAWARPCGTASCGRCRLAPSPAVRRHRSRPLRLALTPPPRRRRRVPAA